jgi:hypothetical protein
MSSHSLYSSDLHPIFRFHTFHTSIALAFRSGTFDLYVMPDPS